jgi:hypothetical protein
MVIKATLSVVFMRKTEAGIGIDSELVLVDVDATAVGSGLALNRPATTPKTAVVTTKGVTPKRDTPNRPRGRIRDTQSG